MQNQNCHPVLYFLHLLCMSHLIFGIMHISLISQGKPNPSKGLLLLCRGVVPSEARELLWDEATCAKPGGRSAGEKIRTALPHPGT